MFTRIQHLFKKILKGADPFIVGGYFFSILYATIIIIPLYFVIVSAFKDNSQIVLTPLALPVKFDFSKFIQTQTTSMCCALV